MREPAAFSDEEWNPGSNISRATSGIRSGLPIFQARVQVDSRFRDPLWKFQPGAEHLEAGLENLESGYEKLMAPHTGDTITPG